MQLPNEQLKQIRSGLPILYKNSIDHSSKGGKHMSGIIITEIGIGMSVLAVILFIASIVYRNTAGKKIREELGKEY